MPIHVLLQACLTSVGYQSSSSRPCNIFSCQTNSDCSQNGVCTSGSCQCFKGYTGASCSISLGPCPQAPAALPPSAASAPQPDASLTTTSALCCGTGVVDRYGNCCPSGSLCWLQNLGTRNMRYYQSVDRARLSPQTCSASVTTKRHGYPWCFTMYALETLVWTQCGADVCTLDTRQTDTCKACMIWPEFSLYLQLLLLGQANAVLLARF